MEHSRSKGHAGLVAAALVALDLAGRVSLPAALLALAHGHADWALVASTVVVAASGVRGLLFGRAVELALARSWRRLLETARRLSPSELKNCSEEQEGLVRLIAAVRETASFEAQALPQLIALSIAVLAVVSAVYVWLGPEWLLLGVLVALIVGTIAVLGQRNLRRSGEQAFRRFGYVARDVLVLFEASVELRAHAREDALRATLFAHIDAMGRDERRMTTWSAMTGLFPAGIAVLAVVAPIRAGLQWVLAGLGMQPIADVGILGGTGLVIGFGFVRLLEDTIRTRPYRRAFDAFVARSPAAPLERPRDGAPPPPLHLAEIHFDGVSCVHPGATARTPAGVEYRWTGREGLALSGPNGAGKSTLMLALLGLVEPSEGRISIGGTPLGALDLERYRGRIIYIPQGAYTAPSESVRWHLQLLEGRALTDTHIDAALARVGLLRALEAHASRGSGAPRDVLAGELSGGERQRMHLARAFLHDAELILLDEPEVGLDEAGRIALRALLDELAERCRVLVVAHDESIIPAAFARLRCARGAWEPSAVDHTTGCPPTSS
jgi:ABC-type multidrug transport system fused ATPase/permease subunit